MLKIYKIGVLTYQFEEGTQPAGAVEVKAEKTVKPANKAATPKNKSARGAK